MNNYVNTNYQFAAGSRRPSVDHRQCRRLLNRTRTTQRSSDFFHSWNRQSTYNAWNHAFGARWTDVIMIQNELPNGTVVVSR